MFGWTHHSRFNVGGGNIVGGLASAAEIASGRRHFGNAYHRIFRVNLPFLKVTTVSAATNLL